jgi:H+/gluconate symporter-like permease
MRWRSLGLAGVSVFFSSVLPPTVGIAVLLITDWSFGVVNVVASVVGTLFAPIAGIMQLLQWADLEARAEEGPGASDEVEAAVGSAG